MPYNLLVRPTLISHITNYFYFISVVDYWSNYTTQNFDISAFPAAVATVGSMITLPNMFHHVTSTDFTQGSTEAIGVISSYDMGLPLNGYASSSQGLVDQFADTGTWLWEEFDEFFKNAGFEGVEVFVSDTENSMRDAETGALAIQSFMLLPASILFVLVYLIFSKNQCFGQLEIRDQRSHDRSLSLLL